MSDFGKCAVSHHLLYCLFPSPELKKISCSHILLPLIFVVSDDSFSIYIFSRVDRNCFISMSSFSRSLSYYIPSGHLAFAWQLKVLQYILPLMFHSLLFDAQAPFQQLLCLHVMPELPSITSLFAILYLFCHMSIHDVTCQFSEACVYLLVYCNSILQRHWLLPFHYLSFM